MVLRSGLIATAWLTLIAASPQDGFEEVWATHGSMLTASGISKPMARQALLWNDGQYYLGICRKHLSADDIVFWRTWWKDTPLSSSAAGRKILELGDVGYTDGVRDAKRKPLSAAHCQRLVRSWTDNMKNAITDAATATGK